MCTISLFKCAHHVVSVTADMYSHALSQCCVRSVSCSKINAHMHVTACIRLAVIRERAMFRGMTQHAG